MGSNPTSSASATSGFGKIHDGWSALGPFPVRQGGHPGLLQPVGQGLQLGGEQVPIGVHELPSVVAVPIVDGGPDYIGWILEQTEQPV